MNSPFSMAKNHVNPSAQRLQEGDQLPGDPKASLRQKGHDPSPALPGTRGAADAVGVVTDAVGEIEEEHRQGPQSADNCEVSSGNGLNRCCFGGIESAMFGFRIHLHMYHIILCLCIIYSITIPSASKPIQTRSSKLASAATQFRRRHGNPGHGLQTPLGMGNQAPLKLTMWGM